MNEHQSSFKLTVSFLFPDKKSKEKTEDKKKDKDKKKEGEDDSDKKKSDDKKEKKNKDKKGKVSQVFVSPFENTIFSLAVRFFQSFTLQPSGVEDKPSQAHQ